MVRYARDCTTGKRTVCVEPVRETHHPRRAPVLHAPYHSCHEIFSGTRPRFSSHQHFHSSRSLVFFEIAGREVHTS